MNTIRQAIAAAVYVMALIAAVIVLASLQGCTTLEQKGEDYEEMAKCYGRPDKVVACWRREGQTRAGFEARCCGDDCDLPECPTI